MVDCLIIALCGTDRNLLLILLFRNLTLKLMLKLQPLISQLCEMWWHNSMCFLIITNYSQQNAVFLEFIYFYRPSTCFRRFFRPSSGAHNCTYNLRYCQPILLLAATVDMMELSISSTVAASSSIGWQYLKLYVQLCAPDDGWRNHLKHVERL